MNLTWLISLVISIFSFIPFVKWLQKRRKFTELIDRLPGAKAYPFIGTTYMFFGVERKNVSRTLQKHHETYPEISRSWIGFLPQIEIKKAEHVEKILSNGKLHLEKSWFYGFIKLWLGDGLLIATRDKWYKHRKIITPTFHFTILEQFCEIFAEKGQILIGKFDKYADTGRAIDIYPFITKCALDIIADAAMGTQVNAQDDQENSYVRAVYETAELLVRRMLRPWLHIDFIYFNTNEGKQFQNCLTSLHSFTQKVIEQRKQSRLIKLNSNGSSLATHEVITADGGENLPTKKRLAFLDLLLESNETSNELTDQDIREEVDTFMFGGHDTTTASITWTMLMLAMHPNIQEDCYNEMRTIFGDNDIDRVATLQDLNQMKLLERVIKETLRLLPSVPAIGRTLSEDIELDGYHLPAGGQVLITIEHLHRDKRYFPNPEMFDPDRFLPENSAGRHPYAYIPFSAGVRNCIGQKFAMYEEKSILSLILRKYRFKTNITHIDEVDRVFEVILRPINGMPIIFEKRKN